MENSATSPTVTLDDSNFEKEVTQSDQTVLVIGLRGAGRAK